MYGLLEPDSLEDLPQGLYSLVTPITNTICLGFGDETKLNEGNVIHARPASGCGKAIKQHGAILTGMAFRSTYVARSCGCNAHNAICNRHGAKQPPITSDLALADVAFSQLESEIGALYSAQLSEWAEGWLLKWPTAKREMIEKSIIFDDIAPGSVKLMVKREIAHKCITKARGIQFYRNMATQARYGPEFYSLQKAFTKLLYRKDLGHGIRVTLSSGMNSDELGVWMGDVLNDIERPYFFESDGKNWDACMNEMLQNFTFKLYENIVNGEMADFARACYKVRGVGVFDTGVLKYTLVGTRKSGHNDTTLGNGLINIAITYSAMVECGIKGDIIVAGDDLLVVVDGEFSAAGLADRIAARGIVPEYRVFDDVKDASFVSARWMLVGENHITFIPKLGRILARLFWTIHHPPPKQVQAYVNGVVKGLLGVCGELPIFRAFLKAHYDAEGGEMVVGRPHEFRDVTISIDFEIAMASTCRLYGLTVHEVLEFESFLMLKPEGAVYAVHPVFDKIAAVDLTDIEDRQVN